jgi:hypothetical protein
MADAKKSLPPKAFLPVTALHQSESAVRKYHAIIPTGHTKDMIEVPNYWCHVAKKLVRHSRIEVVAEDFSFWGMLVVMASEDTWAKVWPVVWVVQGEGVETVLPGGDDYKVDSIATGWRVIHKQTGVVERQGLANRREAMEAIDDLLKKSK